MVKVLDVDMDMPLRRAEWIPYAGLAWQDFINLKGRMDTELAKVTKRNNYLVEELESWKTQFLKFQAFAEQLTKASKMFPTSPPKSSRSSERLLYINGPTSIFSQHVRILTSRANLV